MEFSLFGGYSRLLETEGFEPAAAFAQKMGFAAVENGDGPAIPDVKTAQTLCRIQSAHGIRTACYSCEADLWGEDGLPFALQQLEITAALECPLFHHTLIPWLTLPDHAPDYDTALKKVIQAAITIAERAKTLGITCIYEDQGLYFNGVEGFGGFWRQMRAYCDNVGICADLGNTYFAGETPVAFLEAFSGDVVHVHVKDYLRKRGEKSFGRYWMAAQDGCWLRDTMVGSGVVDFESCMKLLQAAGYQGVYAIEYFAPEPYIDGLLQAKEYLQRFI